jgi:enoyl-CoA hydratase
MSIVETTVDVERGIAEIFLNRPEKVNAINSELEHGLLAALSAAGADERVRCIVLAANGRGFSAGYDLVEHTSGEDLDSAFEDWADFQPLLRRWLSVRNTPVPIVAAVHGFCYGIATLLVSMTDIVVIAEDAKWGSAKVRGGGGYNGPSLTFLVGPRKAREIDFRSAELSGREAAEIGWANYAVPADEVLSTARTIATDVAMTPRDALVMKKAQLNRLMDSQGFVTALDDAAMVHTILNFAPGARDMRASIRSVGVRDTVGKWDS